MTIPDGVTSRATVEMTTGTIVTMRTRSRWVGALVQPVRETTIRKTILEIAAMTPRGFERNRDSRNRDEGLDPQDVFMRDLDLPRGINIAPIAPPKRKTAGDAY